jgi:N-methylhydantoinase B/oxoprolinase/acetone carboxylase alpha subunit
MDGSTRTRWFTPADEDERMNSTEPRDSVLMTVVANYLRNLCHEMGTAMMKTSYSSIFNEGLDFSCVVFDAQGRALASGEFCPAQIGAINITVEWCLRELGIESLEPGDVVIHNDPYRGGCHLPEHLVLKPVFLNGELLGFVANLAHLTEIGGKAPGGFAADAVDVFQEGLRLPPLKIVRQGEPAEDVWRIILTNHRTPRQTRGDLYAMIGSLSVGEQRLTSLAERHGVEKFHEVCEQLLDYSETRMRNAISRIPDGEYRAQDRIEDDGVVAGKSYWIRARVVVDGDMVICDFRDSDDQAVGPCNMTFGVTLSAAYNAMLHLTSADIPRNAGCYRPIRVLTRPGTVTNVAFPGPSVGGNSEIHSRVVDVLFGAMASALPDRVPACSGATSCNFLFGGVSPRTGEYYTNYHLEGSGWGALPDSDGNSVLCAVAGNCRNTPVEVFETRYPWRVVSLRMVADSGGAGRHRGGLASERILEVTAPEVTVSEFADRTHTDPWGLAGGLPGRRAATLVCPRGETDYRLIGEVFGRPSSTKYSGITLRRGDRVLIRSAGGGGHGDPRSRPRQDVVDDLAEGFITNTSAAELYGLNER